ncbi:MAG: SRPBCC family protein [Planctomycetes bacterium]|nr:SRPBCC family protein [Planctomycetota bacterium]
MGTIQASVQVAAPQERVFKVFTQIEKAPEHIPQIQSVEMLTEGPFGNGTRWRETRLFMKKQATEEMWVTGFEAPNRYTVEANSNGMLYDTLFEFTPSGEGTQVTWTFNSTPQTFGAKVMSPIFNLLLKGTMKKCMQGDLDALKGVCESKGE